jgi:peptidoglycan/LPS O-acetylase OafA/YrhL
VPALFFNSGFLISASRERNPNLRIFGMNLALRIFPALWAVVLGSALSLIWFCEVATLRTHTLKAIIWTLCQASILQQ